MSSRGAIERKIAICEEEIEDLLMFLTFRGREEFLSCKALEDLEKILKKRCLLLKEIEDKNLMFYKVKQREKEFGEFIERESLTDYELDLKKKLAEFYKLEINKGKNEEKDTYRPKDKLDYYDRLCISSKDEV